SGGEDLATVEHEGPEREQRDGQHRDHPGDLPSLVARSTHSPPRYTSMTSMLRCSIVRAPGSPGMATSACDTSHATLTVTVPPAWNAAGSSSSTARSRHVTSRPPRLA